MIRIEKTPWITLFISAVMSVLTVCYIVNATGVGSLIYAEKLIPRHPSYAIAICQLLATFTGMMQREAFLVACETLRWALAIRSKGTWFLTFLALSEATGFAGQLQLLFAKGRPFVQWRIWALYRLFLLYIVLLAAQFIFLININPDTSFRPILHLNPNQSYIAGGISKFQLIEQKPFPFAMYEVWGFLSNPTQVKPLGPCKDKSPGTNCTSYALVVGVSVVVESDDYFDYLESQIKTDYPSLRFPSVPIYVIEFVDDVDPNSNPLSVDTGAYCYTHSNLDNLTVRFCLASDIKSNPALSSRIRANLQFCYFADCEESQDPNVTSVVWFDTEMDIKRANATVIINAVTNEILETPQILESVPYELNIQDYFTAFIGPLTYNPWNLTAYYDAYALGNTSEYSLVFANPTPETQIIQNTTADAVVEFLAWSFSEPIQSQNQSLQLQAFLAYALSANSASTFRQNTTQAADVVKQTYHLDLNSKAVVALVILYGLMFVCTALMLGAVHLWKHGRIPNTTTIPDMTIMVRKGRLVEEALAGLSNAKGSHILKKVKNLKLYVGPVVEEDGLPHVAMSMTPFPVGRTLKRGVKYF